MRPKKGASTSDKLAEEVARTGSIQSIKEVPDDLKATFKTAYEIPAERHVRMQAAAQRHCDNAVSKTVNIPSSATVEDVESIFLLAHKLKCKGITVFRQGSRVPVLSAGLQRCEYATVRERPRVTSGQTEKLKTGCGSLYITINRDENNRPIEVFSSLGKEGGGCAASSEAAARLVSLCLRCDVNPREIVRQLRGIRCAIACSARAAGKPVDVQSCPDGVAQAIERILGERQESAYKARLLAVCPSCGGQREPGRCGVCLSCWEGGCEAG